MRNTTLVFTFTCLVSLLASASSSAAFQNPQETPAKPVYRPTGSEVTLTGTVIANGLVVSDEFGNYEIRGLPAGTYKLVAWHELLGEQEIEVTVVSGENRKIDFTFDVPVKPGSRWE